MWADLDADDADGIGCDVVSISAFTRQLDSPGTQFAQAFTPGELRASDRTGDRGAHLAARWAAKEAVIKAWSSSRFGLPPLVPGVAMSDIEVRLDRWSRPTIVFRGELAGILHDAVVLVSLTHDIDADVAAAVATFRRPSASG